MPKVIFIFLVLFCIILAVFSGGAAFNNEIESAICLGFIILLGIPHGAIDNHLFLSKSETSKLKFYIQYLSLIAINALIWFLLPQISFIVFMLVSAFHFGQSQFNHFFERDTFRHRGIYLTWGVGILSGLILYNISELEALEGLQIAMGFLFNDESTRILAGLHIASIIFFVALMIIMGIRKEMHWKKIMLEGIVFLVILTALYLFPPLVGFSLYFVILHSMKVMEEEFTFLKSNGNIGSLREFLLLLLPFTAISIFGIFLLIGMIHFEILNLPYGYLFLILISSITLPHIFVMDKFYN